MSEPTTAAGRAHEALMDYELFDPESRRFVNTDAFEAMLWEAEAEARAEADAPDGYHYQTKLHEATTALAAEKERVARLRSRIEDALTDEPVWKGNLASEGVKRWYSEGWNRLRRDIEAILATEVER